MEVGDAVGAPVSGRDPVRAVSRGPTRAVGWADAERSELVESEDPVGEVGGDVLDPLQLGVGLGVGRFLPGPGALEGDALAVQQAP